MRIKLINPSELDASGAVVRFKRQCSPGLTLPYLAALIPGDHDVEIIEDAVEGVNYDAPADMVGITAMTSHAPRAYQIADEYRRRGVPVIMGGFHPTFCTDEALLHCDSVVVGEAEGLFDAILEDLAKDDLKPIYRRESPHPMTDLPTPRYDLIKFKNYEAPFYPVQISRGCPHRCVFCSVTKFWGSTYRYRPIEDVVRDVKAAGKFVFIVDDNIGGNPDYIKEVFKNLKALNRPWLAQCSLKMAEDESLLRHAREAGGMMLYLGFETLNRAVMPQIRKTFNSPDKYENAARNLRRYNISVMASLIVGFDEDGPECFDNTISFLETTKAHVLCLYILTPLPGTDFYGQCEREGRLLTKDWSKYNLMNAVFTPKRMTPEELEEGYWRVFKRFYSIPSIAKRLLTPPYLTMLIYNMFMIRPKIMRGYHTLQGIPLDKSSDFFPSVLNILTSNKYILRMGDIYKNH